MILPQNRAMALQVFADLGITEEGLQDTPRGARNEPPPHDRYPESADGERNDASEDYTGYGVAPETDEKSSANEAGASQSDQAPLPILTISEWRDRDMPEPDFLMGSWFSTTNKVLISAPTGIGKSNFSIALGMRIAAGMDFLHWRGRRTARVLYIDGEMAGRLLKDRVIDEAARLGIEEPASFFALSHEDIRNFKPLNTPEGQAIINALIKRLGGVDMLIFDNIMSLAPGDLKDQVPWQQILPWSKSLTRAAVGQIWIHHTGHDESRSYGDKTREWGLDTVAHFIAVKRPDTDVSFTMEFRKARERTPTTRFDFQDVKIALVNDRWEHEVAVNIRPERVSPQTAKALDALTNVIASDQAVPLSGNRRAAHRDHWAIECNTLGLLDFKRNEKSATTMFNRFRRELVAANRVACEGDLTWLIR